MARPGTPQRSSAKPRPGKLAARAAAIPELSRGSYRAAGAAIAALAAFLRLYRLGLKPLHHDEGVNGFFLFGLVHNGFYRYDPANYHGPSLYYLSLAAARVNALLFGGDGLSEAAIRLTPALFGIATVALVLALREELGARGALIAAAAVAVSPGAVFYSRYFIHETLLVFFTAGVFVCGALAYHRRRALYLLPGAAAAGFLLATKETAVISMAVPAIALACERALHAIWPWRWGAGWTAGGVIARLGGRRRTLRYAAAGLLLVTAIFVALYSSFFHNFPQGVLDAMKSLTIWTKTGVQQAFNPWYLYLKLLAFEEWPAAALAIAGIVAALLRGRTGFAFFAGIWAVGMLLAYTLIPYKTPWLALNFIVPMCIASAAAAPVWERLRGLRLQAARLLLAALFAASLARAVRLNFERYDDNADPYVYVHTTRDFVKMVREIDALAARTGMGRDLSIGVTAPEYWPLPWYLREYSRVAYWGKETVTLEAAIVASKDQETDLQAMLGGAYRRIQSYEMRPGVTLVLFERADLLKP